ncbi:TKL protein kinase [Saprolegnia parasitica CBS 223.65]|uniref:TKL protein kinase n=1 Tax=Saprolegnia parasitica (strain CBS 223.65) TaxID=695850 RepID=A0A067C2D3_SAPPC|nr:TKL protein kinase [Saprolegnia parasitica CBS 223.65]KDO20977.1 TKL protein kinase [Saprolegnia parasitica CBS 223.65]|eukprot:XP_012208290.1 TKL protein kinase [Saprolegnia parasitica CBS 223.65]
MLRDEIKLQKMIRSPYVLPLLATVDLDPNNPMMVTEFMDQGTLYDYLAKKRRGEPVAIEVTTVQVAWVIANALLDLHRQNIIHRDVKSLKVLLSSKHGVKLSGIASARTVHGLMTHDVGTTTWMAPEVLRIDYEEVAAYGTPADIYSFGVVLTELDTGDEPYAADFWRSHSDITARVRAGTLRPSMGPNCAPWLRELADRCLAFDPAERPTAADIVAILVPHLNDQPAP